MNKRIFTILIVLTTISNIFAINGDLGGPTQDGSTDHPYLIEDFNDFQAFCDDPNYWGPGLHTQLTCDLDLDPNLPGRQEYIKAPIAYTLYGNHEFYGIPFTGNFDGNSHIISNLTINSISSYYGFLGLFGQISSANNNIEIKNLGLENLTIIGNDNTMYAGGLCGYNDGCYNTYNSNIDNCYTTGKIVDNSDYGCFGGLCGYNSGNINNCYSTCSASKNDGSLSGGFGGLCGANNGGAISNCYATGDVITRDDAIGGLCGSNGSSDSCTPGIIINCYATGNVTGRTYVGGLCGINGDYGTITKSYTTGTAQNYRSSYYLGGLCGLNFGQIDNSYSNNITIANSGSWYVGGLCGGSGGLISDSNSLGIVCGENLRYAGGLCGENYHQGAINNSFSFCSIITDSSEYIGGLCGHNYQSTIKNCYTSGNIDCNTSSEYIGGLCGINDSNIYDCYSTGSIDCNTNSKFIGGLCGENKEEGTINNCYASGQITIESAHTIGGLCGTNFAPITNCYTICDINCISANRRTTSIGGLIAENGGDITNCYALGSITTGDYVNSIGGLIAGNGGDITNCYASCPIVTGTNASLIGGLFGSNHGNITNCYTTGLVCVGISSYYFGAVCGDNNDSTYNNCFWNTETSGQINAIGHPTPDPAGLTGKTTAEMKTKPTFTDADWDFITTWNIGQNQTYPYLRQYSTADLNNDKAINFEDFAILANNWLTGTE